MASHETVPGFPQLLVTAIDPAATRVTARLDNAAVPCMACGRVGRRRGTQRLTLADLPRGWQPAQLTVEYQRLEYTCHCGRRQPHPLEVAGVRASATSSDLAELRMTQRLYDAVVDRYLRGAAMPTLEAWCGVKARVLWPHLSAELDRRIAAPRDTRDWHQLTHIGIDELFWRGQPLGVVVDLQRGSLLDLLPDRDPETLRACLSEIKAVVEARTGQPWSPVITTDMWEDYRTVARQVFGPQVKLVVDRFHLLTKVPEDLQEVGRALLQPSAERPRQLTKLRRAYFRLIKEGGAGASALDDSFGTDVRRQLGAALDLACAFHGLWSAASFAEAEQRLFDWIGAQSDFESTKGHEVFGRLTFLLANWKAEILAFHSPELALAPPEGSTLQKRPSNAMTEGVNAKIRAFERRSQASRRLAWGGQNDQKAQVQRQFDRFRVRVLHAVNMALPTAPELISTLVPELADCECGASVDELSQELLSPSVLWDLPLGDQPVRAEGQTISTRCRVCGCQKAVSVSSVSSMTQRLHQALTRQAELGRPLRRLSQEAGPEAETLGRHLNLNPPVLRMAGPWIGILRWRWAQELRWLITDADTGRPLELLSSCTEEAIRRYLDSPQAARAEVAFLSTPGWSLFLPDRIKAVLDPFSAIQVVQPALQEVQWRYTAGVSVATRRTARFRGHRRAILENPQTRPSIKRLRQAPDPVTQRQDLLRTDPGLRQGHTLMQHYRAALASDLSGTHSEVPLQAWEQETRKAVQLPSSPGPMDRSLHYGFEAAVRDVREHRAALSRGMRYRRADRKRSLARSRRALRDLQALEAARGKSFETLRRAVLNYVPNVIEEPITNVGGTIPPTTAGRDQLPQEQGSAPTTPPRDGLSAEQRAVVKSSHSVPTAAVLAVAGAGKTRVLVERAEYLIAQGLAGENILFLTFTIAARDELNRRFQTNRATEACEAQTIHAFCRLLLGMKDLKQKSRALPALILEDLPLAPHGFKEKKPFLKQLSRAKQQLQVEGIYDHLNLPAAEKPSPKLQRMLHDYERRRQAISRERGALQLDNDDVLLWGLSALQERTDTVMQHLTPLRAIIVDEYQDVSPLQARIINEVAAGKHLMAVGDPGQSIFGFQGGSPQLLEELSDHAGESNFVLSDNYRCPGQHLLAAAAMLDDQVNLVPATGFRGELAVHSCTSRADGLTRLRRQMQLWAGRQVTVLVRSNWDGERVKAILGNRLLGRKDQKRDPETEMVRRWQDPACQQLLRPLLETLTWHWSKTHPLRPALAFLQLTLPPEDLKWLDRLWMARRLPADVADQAARRSSPAREALDLWQALLDGQASGVPAVTFLAPLLSRARQYSLGMVYTFLRVQRPVPELTEMLAPPEPGTANRVEVMTIHKAKGREFQNVIVLVLPKQHRTRSMTDEEFAQEMAASPQADASEWDDSEEPRVAYVALTRSTESLCVIAPQDSAFLHNLSPERLSEMRAVHDLLTAPASTWSTEQLELFLTLFGHPSLGLYLRNHWWNHTDLKSLEQVTSSLLTAGLSLPALWTTALKQKKQSTAPAKVRRRGLSGAESR